MDDLLFFALLYERKWDDERLPRLLADFCDLPARARVPYMAWMHDLAFYLLADPALKEIVRTRGATKDAPKGAISAILDFQERGILSKVEACKLVSLHAAEIPSWAQGVRERRPDVVTAFLASPDMA